MACGVLPRRGADPGGKGCVEEPVMGGGGDLGGPSWEAVGALPLEEWELGAALGLLGITGRALHGAEGLVRCEGGGLRRATESRNSDRGRGGGW